MPKNLGSLLGGLRPIFDAIFSIFSYPWYQNYKKIAYQLYYEVSICKFDSNLQAEH